MVVAGGLLALSAPVLVCASVAIKLESPRERIFFRQVRVGRDRQPFQLLKLRTMVSQSEVRGPEITIGADKRITRVGRWLRATKVDELPQLWNVLRGELSVVGPRPEVPTYVGLYPAEWSRLFDVRPGITDVASLTFRDEASLLAISRDPERAYRKVIMPMKAALALEALEHRSMATDLAIIVRTARALLRRPDPQVAQTLAMARRRIAELDRQTA